MVKSVLQAIPTYVMSSIYLLPDTLIKEIERMLNVFWWGGSNNNKGIKWLAWERMALSKDKGGLGFRDFQVFNLAMVAKQRWNFISKPHALVSGIFKASNLHNMKVQQLMLPNQKQWDESKIASLFLEAEAKNIMAVPLLDAVAVDKIIWKEERNGVYSARSGYKKIMKKKEEWRQDSTREPWGML
ncbi:ribonuclease H [Trifolium pratense]|uniref:Ribonuclease H n=1 Tax=Trifolium pratense TaxID=57577 RepID=A0A2K3L1S5_TRIPR|nr:ribonuclease H [Trifolium pratense]